MDDKKMTTIKILLKDKSKAELTELLVDISNRFSDSYEFILRWQQSAGKIDVNAELALECWEKAEYIIGQFNEYGGGPDDDEDEACEYINDMCKLIPTLSWDVRQEIIDRMLKQYSYHNSGFDDMLTETCFEMCKEKEEWLYLADKLLSFGGSWDKRLVMSIYQKIDADEDYLKLRTSSIEYGNDYLELAQYYERKEDIEKAITCAQEGLNKGQGAIKGLVSYLFDYYEKNNDAMQLETLKKICESKDAELDFIYDRLYEYYKSNGDYENAKANLLLKFDKMRGHNLHKMYGEIKKYLKQEDWNGVEEKLFISLKERNIVGYLHICMEKGLKQEVLGIIINKPISNYTAWGYTEDLSPFADKLKKDFPNEILKYYWDRAIALVERGANRSSYKQSMPYFSKVKEIYVKILKDTEGWNHALAELKSKYKKRRAFLEESKVLD